MFIDDSPIELAEVSANVPGIQCRTFPSSDEAGVVDLLRELRNLFGRTSVTEEDRLRRNSLKSSAALQNTKTDTDSFLAQAGATVTLEWNRPRERSFELINKTNQFNLNGRRLDESQWRQRLADPDGFVLAVSYQDKFGPLGQISVVSGRKSDGQVLVDCWVLSCRAFSRRIEQAVVRSLFEHFEVERLSFDFQITDRNGPLQTALSELLGRPVESGTVEAGLAEFESNCPRVFAEVITDDSSERNPRAA